MSDALDFQVDKRDLRHTRFVPATHAPLGDGQIRVRIDRFALTANNVTYGATGDQLGYWAFFPTDDPAWGRVPVWGFAEIVESKNPALAVGERLYGYWPMSTHLVLTPGEIGRGGFVDAAEHRAKLPAIYNRYTRVAADPSYSAAHEPAIAVFRPLFTTAWLIDDFLAEQHFFAATQIVLTSASSKTSLGLAFLLARRGGLRVVGLTGAANADFVKRTGYYTDVVAYDDTERLAREPSVLVDMAGDRPLRRRVHAHLGGELRFSSAVGFSHWEAGKSDGPLAGPEPKFFFAPEQAKKRIGELGPAAFNQRLAEDTRAFLGSATWLRVVEGRGREAIASTYQAMLEGRADPAGAHIVGFA